MNELFPLIGWIFGIIFWITVLRSLRDIRNGIADIRDALIDAEFPVISTTEAGITYRVHLFRVRGRYGATYHLHSDDRSVSVAATFSSRVLVLEYIKRTIADLANKKIEDTHKPMESQHDI